MNVKRYEWVACDEHACHCDVVESAEGDMVDYEDYAALEARCAALAAENAGLKNAITAVSKTSEECEINGDELKYVVEPSEFDALTDLLDEIPATDALLAEMRAQAHKEGAHFVANRMLAAWEAGFIDDTAKNAADIARMILTSTEFMADAPEGDFDRSFADGVLEDIAVQLRKEAAQ
ncbi:ead/Ea22-like family protein [Enterobacter hormaechei subsp. steigerwaltii]|uniref:ead/Ea22-like family protein n=1 Tax=Enterobacter hormaechei TaxID=158836 RepID=UPI0018C23A30|nr:ead/Ea22-like family protein [Enterobacter hormaechei]MBG0645411.1 ead/Ea22-like family protein [Enterobacter hormaechei]MCU2329599.1 ead/Ea22-like family protein [Enterobacter hormaechei subsp. steigerwaltii]